MKKKINLLLFVLCSFLLFAMSGFAAEEEKVTGKTQAKPQGPPPALVEVAQIVHGETEASLAFGDSLQKEQDKKP